MVNVGVGYFGTDQKDGTDISRSRLLIVLVGCLHRESGHILLTWQQPEWKTVSSLLRLGGLCGLILSLS